MSLKSTERRPILIIEDDVSDIELIKRSFQEAGVKNPLIFIENGKDAIEFLIGLELDKIEENRPVLIMLDLNLPQIHGFRILELIQDSIIARGIPTVVLTGSSNKKDYATSYDRGANSVIYKGTDSRLFTEHMQTVSDYWLQVCKLPA